MLKKVIRKIRSDGLSSLVDTGLERARLKINPVRLGSVACEFTNACTLHCPHCVAGKIRKVGFMEWVIFKNLVDEADSMGVRNFGVQGFGESLCHPDFKRYLKYLVSVRDSGSKGIRSVGYVSNGMLFSKDVADLFCELEVDNVGFSLDGFKKVNDEMRKGGSYDLVKSNIEYLLERRGKQKKPVIRINTINPVKNMKFVEYWMNKVDLVSWFAFLKITPEKKTIDTSFFEGRRADLKRCGQPFVHVEVLWNGVVHGCCNDGLAEIDLGDLHKQSLRNIWSSSQFDALRYGPFPKACLNCEIWKYEFKPSSESCFGGRGVVNYFVNRKVFRRVKKLPYIGNHITTDGIGDLLTC